MEESEKLKKKKNMIHKKLYDIKIFRDINYRQFKKYKKINLYFDVSNYLIKGCVLGFLVSGFVFYPLFIVSGCLSSLNMLLSVVHNGLELKNKQKKYELTYRQYTNLISELEIILGRNNLTSYQIDDLLEQFNSRVNIINDSELL
jgi:hypothetical protein